MSDTHEATRTTGQPLPMPTPAPLARTKAERVRVTGKLKVALDAMIYEGQRYDDAARASGLLVRSMRRALERPYVQTYLRAQKQVFRASVSAQNIHKLAELRDSSGNAMAQLGAIKVLEQIDGDPQAQSASIRSPGFVIVVNAGSQPSGNAKPLIELHSEPREEG